MLAQRIATALVLVIVLGAALAWPSPWPFAALMLVLVAACAWEWGRLCGGSGIVLALATALAVALGLMGGWTSGALPWWVSSLAWWLGVALVLKAGVGAWRAAPSALRAVTGVAILVLTWWAVMRLRMLGINTLVSTLALVWASDIAAYFGGKAYGTRWFGPRKLAASISPGKTWEGAVSGMAGALALALLWVWVFDRHLPLDSPSLYTRLLQSHGWPAMVLAVMVLVAAGIVGDLFESLVKRAAGAKDSSRLLPGHGGVLDRVDALLPVLPMAVAALGAGGGA